MKTDISAFCAEGAAAMAPMPRALLSAAQELARLVREEGAPAFALPALNELRARFRSLTEKLESQQAYLLIFGPLKSGKSTLINALSGAYVSEVTSLPGYPCLVYVQHAPTPRFAVTRFNGRESTFADSVTLKNVIADSHQALAREIRQAENAGVSFEPSTHYPEAIRRVDVQVPVASLAESNTALVDTPGLYSRMNFGYDVLTREFRDSAACAVFVVKTDNLFLEQVFEEFDQLLGLFSRIFLVINVDASKRDLQADGTLQPSAESADPQKIVEAFTTLSMSGPLRQAYEQNRVRIHALDLLNAAATLLHAPAEGAVLEEAQRRGAARFDAFEADLTEYLNSNEYTLEFMRDSLRQGRGLCAELRGLTTDGEVRALRERQDALALEMRLLEHRTASAERLVRLDWPAAFTNFYGASAASAQERAGRAITQAIAKARQRLAEWFATEESLKDLEEKRWAGLLTHAGEELAEDSRSELATAASTPFGGAEISSEAVDDLHRVGINLPSHATVALAQMEMPECAPTYELHLALDDVPIARTWMDWLLFRRRATIRRRVFGEDGQQAVPLEVKAQRLPEANRESLAALVAENIQLKFGALAPEQASQMAGHYVERFDMGLRQALQRKREQFTLGRQALQRESDANAAVLAILEGLEAAAAMTEANLAPLDRREVETAVPAATEVEAFPESVGYEEAEALLPAW